MHVTRSDDGQQIHDMFSNDILSGSSKQGHGQDSREKVVFTFLCAAPCVGTRCMDEGGDVAELNVVCLLLEELGEDRVGLEYHECMGGRCFVQPQQPHQIVHMVLFGGALCAHTQSHQVLHMFLFDRLS